MTKNKERVKSKKQGMVEFFDTVVWDINKISELKSKISIDISKIDSETKLGELKKPWIQTMTEQIILFYKVVIFHQDCVRMVLTLINEIALADDERIDAIINDLGERPRKEIMKGTDKAKDKDKGILNEKTQEYKEIRAKTNLQDTEEIAQQSRRVVAFNKTRRVRLLYYLLYNRYRISENDLVQISSKHPLALFLTHFNKFISNKMEAFVRTPIKKAPKDPAKELKILRDALVGNGPLSEWEKMYLMGVLMSRNKQAGGDISRALLKTGFGSKKGVKKEYKTGFGSNKELKKEYKTLEREIYEFSLERCLMILFDHGFKLDQTSMKKFVDQYTVAQNINVEGEKRTVDQRAEDYITQMMMTYDIFKKGLFHRPVEQFKQGQKVFEYILEEAYLVRPMQLLKTVPDYADWARKIGELADHKNFLVEQCGKKATSCMGELSMGRAMYFIMTHLLLINKVLMRLASERIRAGKNSYKYTKKKKETEALFKLQDWSKNDPDSIKTARKLFDPKMATHEPIYDTDLYTMAIIDTESWDKNQKESDDVLIGFIHPRVLSLFEHSAEEDPHKFDVKPRKGIVPRRIKYNDFENIIYRTFSYADNMPTRIEEYESIFLGYSLNQLSRLSNSMRPSMRYPILSLEQVKLHKRAATVTKYRMRQGDNNFGLLREKVKKYGYVETMKYLWRLHKNLSEKQKKRNRKYIKFVVKQA